jgi:hypothetical protein
VSDRERESARERDTSLLLHIPHRDECRAVVNMARNDSRPSEDCNVGKDVLLERGDATVIAAAAACIESLLLELGDDDMVCDNGDAAPGEDDELVAIVAVEVVAVVVVVRGLCDAPASNTSLLG